MEEKGYFYKPTVIKNVTTKMNIAQEEVFGPAAPIIVADNDTEAIKIANDSNMVLEQVYGLKTLIKPKNFLKMIQSGIVSVNNVVASDPRVPFGGVKNSGFGRELSRYGMMEFVNIKTVRLYDQLVHQHHVE